MRYYQKAIPIKHTLVFGKQGSGKDLLIVGWLYRAQLEGKVIYSNSPLEFPHKSIDSVSDVEEARDGILYLHDMDLIFNSRDFKNNSDSKNGLLELVNNMRKHGLSLYGSCHRPKSIDVKVRTLVNYWINPRMVRVGDDPSNLWHYNIIYDVFDEFGLFSHSAVAKDLPVYAGLYNTYDCVKALR